MLGYPLSKEKTLLASQYTIRLQNSFFKSLRRLWTTIYRDDVVIGPPNSLNKMSELRGDHGGWVEC